MTQQRRIKQTVKRRAPLTERHLELMLARLLADPELLRQVHRQLPAEDFLPHHKRYALVMAALEDYFAEFRVTPSKEELLGEIEHRLREDPDGLDDDEYDLLDDFIQFAYREKPVSQQAALKYFRWYGEDCVATLARRALNDDRIVPDVRSLISGLTSRMDALAATDLGVELPFSDDDNEEDARVQKVPTGIDFLDEMFNGGEGKGEVTLFLSPHGTCKTLIACQLSYNRSQMARVAWHESGRKGPLGFTYLFYWEDPRELMQVRIGCYAAHIDRNKLEAGISTLNGPGQYDDYERERFAHLFADPDRVVSCEQQRFKAAKNRLMLNWRMVDMRGVLKGRESRGGGWFRELVSIIEADQAKQRAAGYEPYVAGVYIDYLGAMCLRHLYANSMRRDELWGLLKDSALNLKNELAGRFNTTVWVNHQLDAKGNSLPPGKSPDRTMAADCKVVGENYDFVFCCGTKTKEDSYALFSMDKGRRAPGASSLVIHIDGRFGRVQSTYGKMVVDERLHKIVSAAERRQFSESVDEQAGVVSVPRAAPTPLTAIRRHK